MTFLFTDIQGSTPLWERAPQKMAAALQIHNAALRPAIEANGGTVFKTVGDAFQAAFATAPQALKAAIDGQRLLQSAAWNELGPLAVRMGLHTGEADLDPGGDEYAVSHTKNRIGRIHSIASGGQILLSQETADLVARNLPEGVSLKDLGEHRLKGMQWIEHLFQVCATGLTQDFPPLATAVIHPQHNLPIQLTSFIGREKEMAAVKDLLHSARLVTLTGPGGTGKTRLALQTATGLREHYLDGVWLVELAPLSDPALVPALAARALGLREQFGPQTMALLLEYLEQKHLLLILDNCEHVIDACVRLVNELLQSCPKLAILTSSREALGIAGEASFRVPPLALPELHQSLPIETLAQYEAVCLFVERATAVTPGFSLTPTNAPAIVQVCQRLDGIPLAIELAAARVRLLQVAEIAQRLDDSFRLLTGGSRAALERHQTLRASIDWSYGLLSPAERTLLARLSVFTGGWGLEAAEAVGCGEGIQACDVLQLLGMLLDKSLAQRISSVAGLSRYSMLETIRQYAHEKLVESGQAEATRQRHLQYYLELAEKVEWKIRGPDQARILEHLEAELANLRLALVWSLEGRGKPGWDPEPGLRLAAALQWFWHSRSRHYEGAHWLEQLLAGEVADRGNRPADPSRRMKRAKALQVAGYMTLIIGEYNKATQWSEESQDLFRGLGPDGQSGYAYALHNLGMLALFQSDLDRSEKFIQKSLKIFTESHDRFGMCECLQDMGRIAEWGNQGHERAKRYWEQNLALRNEIGDRDGAAGALKDFGNAAINQGEDERARKLLSQSREIFIEAKNEYGLSAVLAELGYLDWIEGKYKLAAGYLDEVLLLGRQKGDVISMYLGLSGLGRLALSMGDYQQAAMRFEENQSFVSKLNNSKFIAGSLCDLGNLAIAQEELEQAARCFAEAKGISQEFRDQQREIFARYSLGRVAYARGDYQEAGTRLVEVLLNGQLYRPVGDLWSANFFPEEILSFVAASQQRMDRAAQLLGATEARHKRLLNTRTPRERQEREACIAALRAAMSKQAFAAALAEGQAMTKEQALAYALEEHE